MLKIVHDGHGFRFRDLQELQVLFIFGKLDVEEVVNWPVLDGDVLMLWSQFHHNQGFLDIRFRHFGGP